MKYFRTFPDYEVVFDVRRPDGKWLGVLEYDNSIDEMRDDLARLLRAKTVTLHMKGGGTENMDVWLLGRTIAEVFVDSPYYRPKQLDGDQCLSCGTICDLVNFAWVCPFHGVKP